MAGEGPLGQYVLHVWILELFYSFLGGNILTFMPEPRPFTLKREPRVMLKQQPLNLNVVESTDYHVSS